MNIGKSKKDDSSVKTDEQSQDDVQEKDDGKSFDVVSAIENNELVSREDNPLPAVETKAERQQRLRKRAFE